MIEKAELDRALAETAGTLARHLREPEEFPEALAVFRPLLQPELLRAFVDRDLRCLLSGSPYATKGAPGNQLRLYASDDVSVRVRIVSPQPPVRRTIATITRHTLVGNAGRTPFTLRCWKLPDDCENDVFDPGVRLQQDADIRLEPGDAQALRAGLDAYDVLPSERAAVVLTAGSAPIVALSWLYDRTTLRPVRAEPARREWLLLRELLTFAEMVGDASLAPALSHLRDHPSHFVRWAAAKTAHRLAPPAGLAALRQLTGDPHPQVRGAARRLLAKADLR